MPAVMSGHNWFAELLSAGKAADRHWQSGFHSLWHPASHRQRLQQAAEQLLFVAAVAGTQWLIGKACRLDLSLPVCQTNSSQAAKSRYQQNVYAVWAHAWSLQPDADTKQPIVL